jgi:hypothetical protein
LDLFGDDCPPNVLTASEALAAREDGEARGAVFTRTEVVDFLLDLAGYTEDRPLHRLSLLEPACGSGDFLIPAIKRLLKVWRIRREGGSIVDDLGDAIRAVELHRETCAAARARILDALSRHGVEHSAAVALADRWLTQGDFLLTPMDKRFDFIVGNPPYVRQERIPEILLAEYRRRYRTLYDRADLYIPFIERSLSLLAESGTLGFICADRWTKNRYGGPLRKYIAESFHLKIYVDMANAEAFQSDVSAYPAITVITREKPCATRIAHCPALEAQALKTLAQDLRASRSPRIGGTIRELNRVPHGEHPWMLETFDRTALIRRLEREFPLLEDANCQVGIGVATGADRIFIGDFAKLDVEPDRKLPLATTRDIASGEVSWRGMGVINPFADNGGLVDLDDYPRLRKYLDGCRNIVAARHCARKNPSAWYRTIDRIVPALARKPKLLIPDIKGAAHIVFEKGELYPHHNLYYIVSEDWDLRALQAVLSSNVAHMFVSAYSTKMRGGYLRFQAQYLRRIRIPYWRDVPQALRAALISAAEDRNVNACNYCAHELYGLSDEERSMLAEKAKHGA